MKDASDQIARRLEGKDKCQVLVVYEDQTTRDRATAACDFLVQRFWTEIEFEFFWWRMEYLDAPELGEHAAVNAADADILVFAITCLPKQSWFDRWLALRSSRDGLLLQLNELASSQSPAELGVTNYLQEIVMRSKMDFISASLHRPDELLPDPADTSHLFGTDFRERGRKPTPPSHSGLNE